MRLHVDFCGGFAPPEERREKMQFSVWGVSYQNTPLTLRDKASFSDTQKLPALEALAEAGVAQAAVLSTCNRSEIYYMQANREDGEAVRRLFLEKEPALAPCLFHWEGREAVAYLYQVAAGLRSLVLGEDQILGQVQDALACARGAGSAGKELSRVFLDAVTGAKQVKTALHISENPLSLCSIGVKQLARCGALSGGSALVVGSGKMAALALRYLAQSGAARLYNCNRSLEHALALRQEFPGLEVLPFQERYEAAKRCRVVVSATSSPHLVLRAEQMEPRQEPLYLLDLAVPRDIDPALGEREGVTLFDVDSLKHTAEENLQHRRDLEQQGRAILEDGVEATVDWLASARVDGAVQGLQQLCHEAEEDTCAILERKLSLSDHEKRVLRKFVHAGMKRLVRSPILTLKGLRDEEEQETYMKAVERLFRLEEEPPAGREGGGV